MSCCQGKLSCADMARVEDLKGSALGFGLDANWVNDLFSKYGSTVLALVVEAMRQGFSKEFVMEVITKFEPIILDLLVDLFNSKNLAAADGVVVDGDVVAGEDSGIIPVLIDRFLPQLFEKYLPMILEKYGDKVIQMFVEFIVGLIKKNQA